MPKLGHERSVLGRSRPIIYILLSNVRKANVKGGFKPVLTLFSFSDVQSLIVVWISDVQNLPKTERICFDFGHCLKTGRSDN